MNTLSRWLKQATPDQQESLAHKALTTTAYLRHLAHGRRRASAEMAVNIEEASVDLLHYGLFIIPREELCNVCMGCNYRLLCETSKDVGSND